MVAIFGPTGVGKTEVAIELAAVLRERGEEPAAISCDAIQVYRGLEVLSGAPTAAQQARLEHRLVGFVDVREEFSAGRFAELARGEIDAALARGDRPLVVGGTGLYMRAALAALDLQPPVRPEIREQVERELAERGPVAVHAELNADVAAKIHPNDRKRIARALELQRSGLDPPERGAELWTARLRHPSRLFGLVMDREVLDERIARRVDAMVEAGAVAEARQADARGASRTARSALGFAELLEGDVGGMKRAHRRYARRQLTWMRRMEGIERIDVTDRTPAEVAVEIADSLSRGLR